MSVLTLKPRFLYPYSRQFPFDEVAEKIVKALEKRNWKVPGIVVKFHTYGSGEAKYKRVSEIKGNDFKLHFCRVQGKLDDYWNDTAALEDVFIPKQEMSFYDDESGPSFCLYVGNNWEADKEWFMNSIKVHSKLNKQPRKYLKYSGERMYRGARAKELVFNHDLGREYSPEGDEPRRFNLSKKFKEITEWLEENVLNYILSFPEVEREEEDVVELIPYQGPWEKLYSLCSWGEVGRIQRGKKDPSVLPLSERHAFFGSGRRLVPLSAHTKIEFPKIANEGFIWCDVNQNLTQNSKKEDLSRHVVMEMGGLFDSNYIVSVKLKCSNDVYVADNAAYEERRHQLFEKIAPRDRLTDEELDEALAVRGATIVPITEYDGTYKDPVVLINRELDFDEIEGFLNIK